MNNIQDRQWSERYGEVLNYAQILYWQLERINRLRASGDILNDIRTYNIWSGSIAQLATELAPLQDEEWERKAGRIKSLATRPNDRDIEYFNKLLKECILLMNRKGLLMTPEATWDMK
jgi:hypothetical protein